MIVKAQLVQSIWSTCLAVLGKEGGGNGLALGTIAGQGFEFEVDDSLSADRACRAMADRVERAERLKAAAGIRATGRKLQRPGLHLVLAWRLGLMPSATEAIAAGRSALAAIGLAEHQALFVVRGTDTRVWCHVVGSRIGRDGRAAKLYCDRVALRKWADGTMASEAASA